MLQSVSAGDAFQMTHYRRPNTPAKEHGVNKNCIDASSLNIDHAAPGDVIGDCGEVEMLCQRITEGAIGQRISPCMEQFNGIVPSASCQDGAAPKIKELCFVRGRDTAKTDRVAHLQYVVEPKTLAIWLLPDSDMPIPGTAILGPLTAVRELPFVTVRP